MFRARLLTQVILCFTIAGCAGFAGGDRAVRVYPRPAKDTLIAVNQALRDLNFFPTDTVPSHPNPRLTYFTTAYREESLGEIVYVAVRDLGSERSQVEVLTRGDVTGIWTWSVWWPSIIFEQTDRRLHATAVPLQPTPSGPRLPPSRPLTY